MGDLSPKTRGSPTCLPLAPEPEWPVTETRWVELGRGVLGVTVVLLEQMQR